MRILRKDRDFGSILLGSVNESPRRQRVRIQILISASILLSNAIGATAAIALTTIGIPEPSLNRTDVIWISAGVLPIYIAAAFVLGLFLGTRRVVRQLRWTYTGGTPTKKDAKNALRAPARLTRLVSSFWVIATALFTSLYGSVDPNLIPKVLLVVALCGIVVCAICYILVEFSLRPVAAKVISAGVTGPGRRGRLRTRTFNSWLIGSGVPISGIFMVVLFGVLREQTSKTDVFVGVTVIAAIAVGTGLLLTWLNGMAIQGPVNSVRSAMKQVRRGHTDEEVVVYDGSELGELQAGFNAMVGGLRERERLRDLFGRHVGQDVADAALSAEAELGGIEKTVAVMFVDVIGSTGLASDRRPTEVVSILNGFFEVIVTEVERHHGLVNKFEGDAVLAIFGAPIELSDPAGAALATARGIAARLPGEVPDLSAGIGVSFGPAVAGNVGAIQRFEYTVIGDPVNEAARLSELAKRAPDQPLASGRCVDAADGREGERWSAEEEVTLRGRGEPTQVFASR
ncbi:adenylate/guanylate cyclase domain-containing protein [Williamsia sterculiae]|uniref:Adenylate cyclase n=1 Tax=Williamsia sterculiae TaxID=1344003 RepID=A0A1N7CPY0_9NOCA|nr:adenylate/guanylate cyclase domain-containing protein [Williamsia sterculiae]SIR65623.1 adenylate cyclase [Williamsia sterculiae]